MEVPAITQVVVGACRFAIVFARISAVLAHAIHEGAVFIFSEHRSAMIATGKCHVPTIVIGLIAIIVGD